MKAIVVDIEGKYAVVLAKNGSFIKVKNNKQYKVGHEVELPSGGVTELYSFSKIASVAAAILLFIGIGAGAYAYNSPYSYINVDINPSIEITTNVFDRIIDMRALNTDGEKIIAHGNYKNHKIEAGIEDLLKNAVEEGYLKSEPVQNDETVKTPENAVMFTVSSKKEDKISEIKENIQTAAKSKLKASKVKSEVIVENVSIDKHDEAANMGVSPGKLLLLEKLQEAKPEIKTEEYKNAPVKDIMKIIKAEKDKKIQENDAKIDKSRTNIKAADKVDSEKGYKFERQTKEVKQENGNKPQEYNKSNKENKRYNNENSDKDNNPEKAAKSNGLKDKSKGNEGKESSPKKYKGIRDNIPGRSDDVNEVHKFNIDNEKVNDKSSGTSGELGTDDGKDRSEENPDDENE